MRAEKEDSSTNIFVFDILDKLQAVKQARDLHGVETTLICALQGGRHIDTLFCSCYPIVDKVLVVHISSVYTFHQIHKSGYLCKQKKKKVLIVST